MPQMLQALFAPSTFFVKCFGRCVLVLAVLSALALLSGCQSNSRVGRGAPINLINALFDATLPPDFSGYVKYDHDNPYVKGGVEADGVKKNKDGVWTWVWLIYSRNGYFSHGTVTQGRPPDRPAIAATGAK